MIKALLFDYDGTIAATQERQHDWFKRWGAINGNPDLTHPEHGSLQDLHKFIRVYNETLASKGSSQGVQKFYDDLELPCDMSDFSHSVWIAYKDFKKARPARLYDGMRQALVDISWIKKDAFIGLNSTNDWKTISSELALHGLEGYFGDYHITKEDLALYQGNGQASAIAKPSGISLDLCMRKMGIDEPESIIHIGDTITDAQASHAIARPERNFVPERTLFIGVAWGYEGEEALRQEFKTRTGIARCDHVCRTPSELTSVIKSYFE